MIGWDQFEIASAPTPAQEAQQLDVIEGVDPVSIDALVGYDYVVAGNLDEIVGALPREHGGVAA